MTKVADKPKANGEKSEDPRAATWFKPGNKLGGRPKGSRNQLGEDFLSCLQADFKEHGAVVVERVRIERPSDYLKVVASILPKEVRVEKSNLEELSDDDLNRILESVRLLDLATLQAATREGSAKAARH